MPDIAHLRQLLRAAPAEEFWLTVGFGLLAAAAALYWALVHLKRKRVIEDLPTALIRSAPQGYVELQGQAALMDGDPIHAPLSMRVCTWYSFKVEKREKNRGDRGSHWTTLEHGLSEHLFYLVDATGRCAVDPDGAVVIPTYSNVWYGSSRIPGRYHPIDGAWWARVLGQFGERYRYTEKRIEPGDPLLAIGEFTTHAGAHGGFDHGAAVGERLREWKRDRGFLLREFDADGDGDISMHEWAAARARAESEVVAERRDDAGPPPVDVLGHTRDSTRPFVLAAGTEETLIARHRNIAGGLLTGSLLLLCCGLWAIGIRLSAN